MLSRALKIKPNKGIVAGFALQFRLGEVYEVCTKGMRVQTNTMVL